MYWQPNPDNDLESLRKAAIAVATERTSDIFEYEGDFCFRKISRNGIIQDFLFESLQKANWRLVEERLFIAADIMRVDIWTELLKVWSHIESAEDAPDTCPPVTDWTEYLPKRRVGWHEKITPPYYDTDVIVDRITKRE